MATAESLSTDRLLLRKPTLADAQAVFAYASDVEVTRLVAWPRHESLDDTLTFLRWSEQVWRDHPAGPYLVLDRKGVVIGSTTLDIETPYRAATGFVLARDAWGRGYATEVARAMVRLADALGIRRLAALCHPDNRASARVLEKAGFQLEGVLRRHTIFPNLDPGNPSDVQSWARIS